MICDRILQHLPTLLALSVNSPFWQGRNTGSTPSAAKIMETLPTAGLPPLMRNWSEYVWLLNLLVETGFIKTIRELWWDVRPHHNFGTVEVRICDMPPSLEHVLGITALIQCLVHDLSEEIDRGTYQFDCHPFLIRQNKWRACRYGMDARLVDAATHRAVPARDVVHALVERLETVLRSSIVRRISRACTTWPTSQPDRCSFSFQETEFRRNRRQSGRSGDWRSMRCNASGYDRSHRAFTISSHISTRLEHRSRIMIESLEPNERGELTERPLHYLSVSTMPKQKILVIEDERPLVEVLSCNLEREGFEVDRLHSTGQEGLRQAQLKLPDLIVLDLMLPQKSGLEVCRELKQSPRTRDIPIIMVTAKAEESDQLVGFATGADDYVTKPYSVKILVERIKKELRRRQLKDEPVAGRQIESQGIVIDRHSHRAFYRDVELSLTPTEFRLLEVMLRQAGRAFTRFELMDAAIGEDAVVLERTIDVHIKSLRKKLGDAGDLIETVRGVGYRLHEPRMVSI